MLSPRRVISILLLTLVACGPSGGDSQTDTTSDVPPRPGSAFPLTFEDLDGVRVAPTAQFRERFAVDRGGDAVLVFPSGDDALGAPQHAAVVRTGLDGEVRWATRIGFGDYAVVGGAVDDGQGIALVATWDMTLWVVRLDDTGAVRSAHSYTVGRSFGRVSSLVALADGGLLVVSGPGAMRLDASDDVVWASTVGLVGATKAAVLPDGDFAFVGGTTAQEVARTSPSGEVRFVGRGGVGGTSRHAGIAPTAGGGFLVVTGVDQSPALRPMYTGTYAADGASAVYETVQLDVLVNGGTGSLLFGSGFALTTDDQGRVYASSDANGGSAAPELTFQVVVLFDDGHPVEAVRLAKGFGLVDSTLVGVVGEVVRQAPIPSNDCVLPIDIVAGAAVDGNYVTSTPSVQALAVTAEQAAVDAAAIVVTAGPVECPE